MNIALRILMIAGAIISLVAVISQVRKGRLRTSDSVFWVLFAIVLVLIAVTPQISYAISDLLNVESPVNLIFLILIVILAIREFMMTLRVAALRTQVVTLTQDLALLRHENETNQAQTDGNLPH